MSVNITQEGKIASITVSTGRSAIRVASASVLGGVKIGYGINITPDGVISAANEALGTHAATHAIGGNDAVTPASIGALSLASGGTMETGASIVFNDDSQIKDGKIIGSDGLVCFYFTTGIVNGFGGGETAYLRTCRLNYENVGFNQPSINWNLGILYEFSPGFISINYRERQIFNSTGNLVIDYNGIPHFPLGATGITTPVPSVRSSFTAPFSYIGKAPPATSESATGWTISRIEVASSGSTTTLSASGAWTDRETLTYS